MFPHTTTVKTGMTHTILSRSKQEMIQDRLAEHRHLNQQLKSAEQSDFNSMSCEITEGIQATYDLDGQTHLSLTFSERSYYFSKRHKVISYDCHSSDQTDKAKSNLEFVDSGEIRKPAPHRSNTHIEGLTGRNDGIELANEVISAGTSSLTITTKRNTANFSLAPHHATAATDSPLPTAAARRRPPPPSAANSMNRALLDDWLFLHMAAPSAASAAAAAAGDPFHGDWPFWAGSGPAAYSDSDSTDAGASSESDEEPARGGPCP